MSFVDGCACHVWAIDGYTDDNTSKTVNELYANTALNLMSSKKSKNAKLVDLVNAARITGSTDVPIIIYGGFQISTEGAPEHMWIEHNGYIYDTMPGHPLRRKLATIDSRRHPACEEEAFAANKVGSCNSTLTVSQQAILNRAVWVNDEFTP